jgi:hypothetical protein
MSNILGYRGIKKGILVWFYSKNKENTNKVDPNTIALIKELDSLLLTLSIVRAYLEHITTSFLDYLRLYKASWLKLQIISPLLNSYKDYTLYII